MDYNLAPSKDLKQRALIAAAIALFTQSPIKDKILRVFKYRSRGDFKDRWKKVEKAAKARVEELELPQDLKQELSGISKQIGLEILEWAEYYGEYYSESAFFNNMCWTLEGTIDAENTAKKLVNDQSLRVLKRYRIACINCFEDLIPDLWKALDKNGSDEKYLDKLKRGNRNNSLVVFWSYHINGRANEIVRDGAIYDYGLKRAIDQGSSVAAKYFWEKLTPEEKEKNLEQCVITAARQPLTGSGLDKDSRFPASNYTNIFCFLLNQMSEEQQMKAFAFNIEILTFNGLRHSTLGYSIFRSLLNFPYQQFFIPTAERAWNFLQKENYYDLLLFIAQKVPNYPQSYRELLRYVWQKIPDKESVINIWEIGEALSELCKIEDHCSIELILNGSSLSAREKFIFSYEGTGICYNLADQGKWNTLSNLMKHCLSNKDVALKFKKEEKISLYLLKEGCMDHAARLNELLNGFIASFDPCTKRKREDDEDYGNKGKKMKSEGNQAVVDIGSREKRKDDDCRIISKKIKTDLEVIKVSLNNIEAC